MVKTNLFLIAGLIRQLRGSMDMNRIGGLYRDYPKISLLIALVLFSLVGIPPLSGFWPKLFLFQEAFKQGQYAYILALIMGSFITLYVIAKMWAEVFWKNPAETAEVHDQFADMPPYRKLLMVLPIAILALVTLYIGLHAEAISKVSGTIATQLMDPAPYVEAVLGNKMK